MHQNYTTSRIIIASELHYIITHYISMHILCWSLGHFIIHMLAGIFLWWVTIMSSLEQVHRKVDKRLQTLADVKNRRNNNTCYICVSVLAHTLMTSPVAWKSKRIIPLAVLIPIMQLNTIGIFTALVSFEQHCLVVKKWKISPVIIRIISTMLNIDNYATTRKLDAVP